MKATSNAVLVALAIVWWSGVGVVRADATSDATADAQAHFEQGKRYFQAQMYDRATSEFKAAIIGDNQPEYLYALAQSERLQGDCKDAIDAYYQFLQESANSTDPDILSKRANAEAMLPRCESTSSTPTGPVTPPWTGPAGQAAQSSRPGPSQPVPKATVAAPAPPKTTPLAAHAQPVSAKPSPWYSDALGDGLTGAGLLGGTIGVVALVVANSHASAADGNHSNLPAYLDDRNAASSWSTVGIISLAAGGALLASGVIRYVVRSPRGAETLSATGLPGGGLVQIDGTY
jgi:tetratricopeptide (TPR) repeat protein